MEIKVHKSVLHIPEGCDGVALVDHFLLAVRQSRKNPKYYYYHEKYNDPFDFVDFCSRNLIKHLRSISNYVVITKDGKIHPAEIVKGFHYSTDWEPSAPKFYLLKVKER